MCARNKQWPKLMTSSRGSPGPSPTWMAALGTVGYSDNRVIRISGPGHGDSTFILFNVPATDSDREGVNVVTRLSSEMLVAA